MENKTQYATRGYEVRKPNGESVRRFRYHANAVKYLFKVAGGDFMKWDIAIVYFKGVAK